MNNQQNSRQNLRILGLVIALCLAIAGGLSGYWSFTMSATTNSLRWWGNWLQDVGTEMLGASVTILLVELVIYQKRDEASRQERVRTRRREHFISQLRRARTLEKRQRVIDRMKHQQLLSEAWLYEMNLEKTNLENCDCSEADLFEVNLSQACLKGVNFKAANLRRANLSQSCLVGANLEDADLAEADLDGADLSGANLKDADLRYARFSPKTRLSTGQYWTPDIDEADGVSSELGNAA